jgi:DNA-binding NarL/FixJ family response regulator
MWIDFELYQHLYINEEIYEILRQIKKGSKLNWDNLASVLLDEFVMEHRTQIDRYVFTRNCLKYYLTSREIEVVELVIKGLPNKLIANKLSIFEHTINRHIKNMFMKVGVKNKMELLRWVEGS